MVREVKWLNRGGKKRRRELNAKARRRRDTKAAEKKRPNLRASPSWRLGVELKDQPHGSHLELLLAERFVGPSADAFDLWRREEVRSADGSGAEEDGGGFVGHAQAGEHGVG